MRVRSRTLKTLASSTATIVYHPLVIRRLYVHNYRCLENFELPVSGQSSVLLIGKNGSGKTTVGYALEVLQRIARGTNRVGELVRPKDVGRWGLTMRFEIEGEIRGEIYTYAVAFDFPEGWRKEMRVSEEKLAVGGKVIYTRELAQVSLAKTGMDAEAHFRIDWHLVALPLIQHQSPFDPLFVFKEWLARMLILRPMPNLIRGDSEQETLQPNVQVTDFGAWFAGLVGYAPSAYSKIDGYLKQVMPDLWDIKNPPAGKDSKNLVVQFSDLMSPQGVGLVLPFEDLSDGEKCFMICALVLAANDTYSPLVCFWDEPDNYLAPSEVGHFVLALRKAFQSGGQFIATSHNPEAIARFSDENTFVLYRNSHLEPTVVRSLSDVRASGGFSGDIVDALVRGDV
jgi:ABC-type Mn2+/Zn2+ transport system ATPase subunit